MNLLAPRRWFNSLALFLAIASPAGAVTVSMRDAEVAGKEVLLGDVAEFTDVAPATAKRLAETVLGFAPPPGTQRVVPAETLRVHILAAGFLPHEVILKGKAPVVTRAGQSISTERVTAAIMEALKPYAADGTLFEVARLPSAATIPAGPVRFRVEVPARITSHFFVNVDLITGDESTRLFVTMKAVRTGSVIVAARKIERGELLTPGSVKLETRDLFTAPKDVLTNVQVVMGCRANRSILPGGEILSSAIEIEKLVKRGDRLTLVVRVPGLEIRTVGEALTPGALGDVIQARNNDSKKIVSGRITGSGEMTVIE